MNNYSAVGRLTKDIEKSITRNQKVYCYFTLAIEDGYDKESKKPIVNFIGFKAWGNHAEFLAKYAKKGDTLVVESSIRSYTTNSEEGQVKYGEEKVVKNMKLFSKYDGNNEFDENSIEDNNLMSQVENISG